MRSLLTALSRVGSANRHMSSKGTATFYLIEMLRITWHSTFSFILRNSSFLRSSCFILVIGTFVYRTALPDVTRLEKAAIEEDLFRSVNVHTLLARPMRHKKLACCRMPACPSWAIHVGRAVGVRKKVTSCPRASTRVKKPVFKPSRSRETTSSVK